MQRGARHRLLLIIAVAVATVLVLPGTATSAHGIDDPQTVVNVEFLGEVVILTGTVFDGTEIGGLSSITYDGDRGVYYAISDDQGNRPTGDPVRYDTSQILGRKNPTASKVANASSQLLSSWCVLLAIILDWRGIHLNLGEIPLYHTEVC